MRGAVGCLATVLTNSPISQHLLDMASANVFPVLDVGKATGISRKMRRSKNMDPGIMTSQIESRQRQILTAISKQTASAEKNWIRTREGRRESSTNIVDEEIDPARYECTYNNVVGYVVVCQSGI